MLTPVLMARVLKHAMAIREASYSIHVDNPIDVNKEGYSPMDMPRYDENRIVYRQKDGRQTQEHGYYTIDTDKAIELALEAFSLNIAFITPLAILMGTGYCELWDWCNDILADEDDPDDSPTADFTDYLR